MAAAAAVAVVFYASLSSVFFLVSLSRKPSDVPKCLSIAIWSNSCLFHPSRFRHGKQDAWSTFHPPLENLPLYRMYGGSTSPTLINNTDINSYDLDIQYACINKDMIKCWKDI